MMKNSTRRLRTRALAVFPAILLLFVFILVGSTSVAAQNYVSPENAEQILKPEINTIYASLTSLTPGSATYNRQYATMTYYNTIVQVLQQGKPVAEAIESSRSSVCYPTPNTDCTALPVAQANTIVDSTKVLLSN